jgi:hypothetical protein
MLVAVMVALVLRTLTNIWRVEPVTQFQFILLIPLMQKNQKVR